MKAVWNGNGIMTEIQRWSIRYRNDRDEQVTFTMSRNDSVMAILAFCSTLYFQKDMNDNLGITRRTKLQANSKIVDMVEDCQEHAGLWRPLLWRIAKTSRAILIEPPFLREPRNHHTDIYRTNETKQRSIHSITIRRGGLSIYLYRRSGKS